MTLTPTGLTKFADRQSGPSIERAGSDLASLRARADAVDGGWVINGTKIWTSGAVQATHIITFEICAAKTPGQNGCAARDSIPQPAD